MLEMLQFEKDDSFHMKTVAGHLKIYFSAVYIILVLF